MSHETSYPITYIKDGMSPRLATTPQIELQLRAAGWRPEHEPAPERGTFSPLPPPPPVVDDSAARTPAVPDPAEPPTDSVVPGRRRQRTTE